MDYWFLRYWHCESDKSGLGARAVLCYRSFNSIASPPQLDASGTEPLTVRSAVYMQEKYTPVSNKKTHTGRCPAALFTIAKRRKVTQMPIIIRMKRPTVIHRTKDYIAMRTYFIYARQNAHVTNITLNKETRHRSRYYVVPLHKVEQPEKLI